MAPPTQKPAENSAGPRRLAYLLPDPGIGLYESKKGCSIHVREVVLAFQAAGYEVDLYVMKKGEGRAKDFGLNGEIKKVRLSRASRWWRKRFIDKELWRRLPFFGYRKKKHKPNWVDAIDLLLVNRDFERTVRKGLARRPADLLYVRHTWLAFSCNAVQRKTGLPTLLEVNAVFTNEKAARGELAYPTLSRKIEREAMERADWVLPVTEELGRQCRDFGADAEKVVLMPNAVNPRVFSPRCEPDSERFTLGVVSSMRAYHGIETLLNALARLREEMPDLHLLLIGGGYQTRQFQQQAKELGVEDQCTFAGVVENTKVPEMLSRCAALLAPYEGPANTYGCPMKLYEYMALQRPMIVSRWGDIPNIIPAPEMTLMHEPGDAESLARAIRQLRADPEASRLRTEKAHAFVLREHTWEGRVRQMLELLEKGKKNGR